LFCQLRTAIPYSSSSGNSSQVQRLIDGLNQRSGETVDALRERLAEVQTRKAARAKQLQGIIAGSGLAARVGPPAGGGEDRGGEIDELAKQLAEEETSVKNRCMIMLSIESSGVFLSLHHIQFPFAIVYTNRPVCVHTS
jgi:hypothetical protein